MVLFHSYVSLPEGSWFFNPYFFPYGPSQIVAVEAAWLQVIDLVSYKMRQLGDD